MPKLHLLIGKLFHCRIMLTKCIGLPSFQNGQIDIQNRLLTYAKLIIIFKIHLDDPRHFLYFFGIHRHQIRLI